MSPWQALAAQWWSWCAPAAWHATWFALAGLALERALGARLAPAYRALPWWLFFACFALPPQVVSPLGLGARELVEPSALVASLERARSSDACAWLALAWVAGVAGALARLARAHRRGQVALDAGARAAPRGARELVARLAPGARVELRVARGLASPLLVGIRRATIHVPEGLLERPRELEHALRHELAHHARRDPLRALVVELLAALVWFHPLARVAVRRLAQARELACDARVARGLGADVDGYRAALARAALARDDARLAGSVGFTSGARVLERLAALERAPRIAPGLHALAASLLFACASATLVPARNPAERAFAEATLEAYAAGERVSCFTLHAAALVLRDELPSLLPDSTQD